MQPRLQPRANLPGEEEINTMIEKYIAPILVGLWVGSTFVLSIISAYNSVEAHRHTHELACHVGDDDLCKFHEEEK